MWLGKTGMSWPRKIEKKKKKERKEEKEEEKKKDSKVKESHPKKILNCVSHGKGRGGGCSVDGSVVTTRFFGIKGGEVVKL